MRALLILLLLSLPLAALSQTADQPSGTIEVEDSATTDAAIATRIRAILGELDGFNDVTVTVSSGIVTLRGTTLDTANATELNTLVGRVEGVVAIRNEVGATTDVAERLNPAFARFVDRARQAVAFAPLALIAFGVFILIVLFGYWLARRERFWDRLSPNAFIADIYRQIVRLFFILAGLVAALDILNATALLSGILGAAGLVGLAIGFAVRDTVENFIASIMLSVRQPFRPNDTVEINGDTGKVIRLTSRATILLSFDGNHIRIPNATVFKSRIVNFSRNPETRFTFPLCVAGEADLDAARQLCEETLAALPFTLETPAVQAWVTSVDDFWVTLTLAGWIDQTETSLILARSEAIRLCQAALVEAGMAAPLPTYRVEGLTTPQQPKVPVAAQPVPAAAQDVEAIEDRQLEDIVDQERADRAPENLLSLRAAEE